MNTDIQNLQIKLDRVKDELGSNPEYAALSGMNVLPRNWVVQPYIESIKTGINPQMNQHNDVVGFEFEYKTKIKKHNVDDKPCLCISNSTIRTTCELASGNYRPIENFSQEQINSLSDQSKVAEEVEGRALKSAEFSFSNAILQHILSED
jgi:hypothetical protein